MSQALHPLRVYGDSLSRATERGLATERDLATDRELAGEHDVPTVRMADGTVIPLALHRFLGTADSTDEQLLADVCGPVLDVGCGPGRHLAALAARNTQALGVDISPVAVALTHARGCRAINGSIFGPIPDPGSWRTALLLDGNVGIGGSPARLLGRLAELLSDDGEVLAEVDPPGSRCLATAARIETAQGVSSWFPWARIGADDLAAPATSTGFNVAQLRSLNGRWFARLSRAPAG